FSSSYPNTNYEYSYDTMACDCGTTCSCTGPNNCSCGQNCACKNCGVSST
ncbi:hypothetical protein CI102_5510, partial [Trichoderma harzianum]